MLVTYAFLITENTGRSNHAQFWHTCY